MEGGREEGEITPAELRWPLPGSHSVPAGDVTPGRCCLLFLPASTLHRPVWGVIDSLSPQGLTALLPMRPFGDPWRIGPICLKM